MTPDETIRCGVLMHKRDLGALEQGEDVELAGLLRRAELELPTEETEIAAALRNEVEWAQRWGDLGRFIEKEGREVAEMALKIFVAQLPALLEGLRK